MPSETISIEPHTAIPTIEFKASDCAALIGQHTVAMYQLWAFYTTTVFASIVFAFSATHSVGANLTFMVGYTAFATGEAILLIQTMTIIEHARMCLHKLTDPDRESGNPFQATLYFLSRRQNNVKLSVGVQILGSLCIAAFLCMNAFDTMRSSRPNAVGAGVTSKR